MKLLLLIDSLGSGGAQRQMVTIAPLLKQQGIDVEVLCYYQDAFFIEPFNRADIKVCWIIASNPIIRILKIRSFIRKGNYDAVVSFLNTPDLLNCLAAIGGCHWKVITSERSAKEENFHTLRGKLIGWMKRYSDTIVCNSENARNLWLKYYPCYRNKLEVVYNIVTLPEITSTYIPRKDGKTRIVVAASYQYLKNPINVIEAVNLLDEDLKEKLELHWHGVKRVSLGGIHTYTEADKLVKKYNLQEVIHLHNSTSTVIDKMNEADAVGLFSRFEGLPNAICEAMSLSKAIMMTKVSDYKVLVDENNGVLCDWDDIFSIKKAFEKMIQSSDEQILNAGKESKKKAILLFSEENILEQWIRII